MALLFTKSLGDLIRGIRANKRNEEAYINQCLDECRREARSSDMDMKAQAIAKLTYVGHLGTAMKESGPGILNLTTLALGSILAQHARLRHGMGVIPHC